MVAVEAWHNGTRNTNLCNDQSEKDEIWFLLFFSSLSFLGIDAVSVIVHACTVLHNLSETYDKKSSFYKK